MKRPLVVTGSADNRAQLRSPSAPFASFTFHRGLIGTVDPEVGKTYIVDSFMVVVLGGVGKLRGAVVASFGIGLSNKILEPFIGGTAGAIYAKVAILGVVIWFLQWKPTGLFPAKGRAAEAA